MLDERRPPAPRSAGNRPVGSGGSSAIPLGMVGAGFAGPTIETQFAPWTQTGVWRGMMFDSQMKSIAGIDTRTQPCDAG